MLNKKISQKTDKLTLKRKAQILGFFVTLISLIFFFVIYYPVIISEIKYRLNKNEGPFEVLIDDNPFKSKTTIDKQLIVAVDKDFSIVIPKIGVNSKVIKDVDPTNSQEYQVRLTQGIAHAKGSALPNETGNSFYFAHSSDNFINANKYNSVFYLIDKLSLEDLIYIIYDRKIYKYKVSEVKVVNSSDVDFMNKSDSSRVTLMTCWPAGTTLKRFIVIAHPYN